MIRCFHCKHKLLYPIPLYCLFPQWISIFGTISNMTVVNTVILECVPSSIPFCTVTCPALSMHFLIWKWSFWKVMHCTVRSEYAHTNIKGLCFQDYVFRTALIIINISTGGMYSLMFSYLMFCVWVWYNWKWFCHFVQEKRQFFAEQKKILLIGRNHQNKRNYTLAQIRGGGLSLIVSPCHWLIGTDS